MSESELDITEFVSRACARDYAASAMELGQDAGRVTWQAALDDSEAYPFLDTDEKRETFRRFAKSTGGWTEEEIAKWSDAELNALCIQFVAEALREAKIDDQATDETWAQYQSDSEEGRIGSALFRDDDGRIYYSIQE
jgi:hypothetical protein